MAVNPRRYDGFHLGIGDESNSPVLEILVRGETDDAGTSYPRAIHIAQASDADTDWNVSALTDPGFFIHSVTTPASNYLRFTHTGSKAQIAAFGGTLDLSAAGSIICNEDGLDVDFRVEGDNEPNLFFVDASVDAIGICTATPNTNILLNIYRNDTSVRGGLLLEQDGTGDATLEFLLTAGSEWTIGIDNSASDTFVISAGGDLGTGDEDAIRITDAAPPVVTYNATHPTGTFDYVCETCGEHRSDVFECHGVMSPWHDDVQALGLALSEMSYDLQESPAMRHLADIGVLSMTKDDEGRPWTGINMAAAQWFTWSAMEQMYQRIEALETAGV